MPKLADVLRTFIEAHNDTFEAFLHLISPKYSMSRTTMQVAHRHVHTTRCPNIDIEHPSGHGRTRYGLYVGHPSQHAMLQESIGRRQKSESQCAERQGAGKKKVLDAKKALDLITVRENLLSCDNVFVRRDTPLTTLSAIADSTSKEATQPKSFNNPPLALSQPSSHKQKLASLSDEKHKSPQEYQRRSVQLRRGEMGAKAILDVLDKIEDVVKDTPPMENKASWFGNPAFRMFYGKGDDVGLLPT
ncbi:hypothetical protein EDD15DRAFT_2377435 [Pisolithus albus]|nr:hypothetical protein EDD15DRAFT_2377435 [Pisolithus albus]